MLLTHTDILSEVREKGVDNISHRRWERGFIMIECLEESVDKKSLQHSTESVFWVMQQCKVLTSWHNVLNAFNCTQH